MYAVLPAGSSVIIYASIGDQDIIVREERDTVVHIDQDVWITFDENYINVYDEVSERLVS
ncbi:MAG: hypothetical protein QM373_08885 [Bacillota bacterium]|nr:hypothetical protein [Bacillota bacterium]